MSRLPKWLIALLTLALWRRGKAEGSEQEDGDGRIVPEGSADRRAESWVIALLFAAALCAAGFVVVYAADGLGNRTQLFGIALAVCFALIAVALIIVARHLIVTEHLEEDYPEPGGDPEEQEAVAEVIRESGSRFTRKKLLLAAGGTAAGAVSAAAAAPVLSLGPLLDTSRLQETPWHRGRGLVDDSGRALLADDIETETFYTAYPEGATEEEKDQIGAPLVVVRLDPSALRLPPERARWAPGGILAFSKICTHASCAVALYRKPLYAPTEPRPALVCPCHYSTFDPATGGQVIFGPAGRPLPQLPLTVDGGLLRAGGPFSAGVGPGWWGVRRKRSI